MLKEFTVAISCRKPKDTFVFIKQMESLQHCIEWCRGEIAERGEYDIDFIVVREGVAEAKDPIVWDSRKEPKEEFKFIQRSEADELYDGKWCFEYTGLKDLSDAIRKRSIAGDYEFHVLVPSMLARTEIETALKEAGFDFCDYNGGKDIIEIVWG